MQANNENKMTAVKRKRQETLDRKIEKLEQRISIVHNQYNALTDELSELLDERYPERKVDYIKEALYKAYCNSNKSLEMIISFMVNDRVTLTENEDACWDSYDDNLGF